MPQLIFKGMKKEEIIKMSLTLTEELAQIDGTPASYFTYEYIPAQFIQDGKEIPLYPLVEVKMFDRGQEVKDKMAQAMTRAMNEFGYDQVEIFFTFIGKADYYENGQHY